MVLTLDMFTVDCFCNHIVCVYSKFSCKTMDISTPKELPADFKLK